MSMLTGPEIVRQIEAGRITITPFDPTRVGPNSVNLTLSDKLLIYETQRLRHDYGGWSCLAVHGGALDMAVMEPTVELTIPPEGLTLWPGVLYLGATVEHTETPYHVPCIEGRSSVGRLGLSAHVTAGFGDVNFKGTFTLELTTVMPLRIYAGVPICQIHYTETTGEPKPYAGQYVGQTGPRPSGLWKEVQRLQQRVTR